MKTIIAAGLLCVGLLAAPSAEPEAPAAAPVIVKQVKREEMIRLVGELHPRHDIMLDNEVAGQVTAVHVDTGDRVSEGERLITLSSIMLERMLISMQNGYDGLVFGFREYKPYFAPPADANSNELFLAVEQAQIVFDFQKKELGKMTSLLKDGSVTESEFDAVKMAFDQAANELRRAGQALARQKLLIANLRREIEKLEKEISLLNIKAPFAGKVVEVFVGKGEKVPGDPGGNFLRLVDDSKVDFKAGIPEEYHLLVKPGTSLTIVVPGLNLPLKTKVTRVSPVVDVAGRTFAVEAEIDNAAGKLKPGLFCVGQLGVSRSGLAVPADYVIRDEKGDFVKLKDGRTVAVNLSASPGENEVFIAGDGIQDGIELIK